MDKQQFDIAKAIIKMDCNTTGTVRAGPGKFCAVGGLATVIDPDWAESGVATQGDIYTLVITAFDLSGQTITALTYANDKRPLFPWLFPITRRRARVMKVLKSARV